MVFTKPHKHLDTNFLISNDIICLYNGWLKQFTDMAKNRNEKFINFLLKYLMPLNFRMIFI